MTPGLGGTAERTELRREPKTRRAQITDCEREEALGSAGSRMHGALSLLAPGPRYHTAHPSNLLPTKDNNFQPAVLPAT